MGIIEFLITLLAVVAIVEVIHARLDHAAFMEQVKVDIALLIHKQATTTAQVAVLQAAPVAAPVAPVPAPAPAVAAPVAPIAPVAPVAPVSRS